MTNPYYAASGNPGTGSTGLSSLMRAEFASISAAFDLLPAFSGIGGLAVVVNGGGSGLTLTTGQLALAGNFSTTGAFNTVFAQSASITITLPGVSGTMATLAGTETLTNKTLVAPALGTPVSGVMTNVTGTAAGLTAGNATTATNQSGGTVSATTLAASSTVSGQGFIDRLATPGPIGNTSASTGAFTTLSASSTVSGSGFSTYLASPPAIGGSAPAAGAFTTLSASSTATAPTAAPGTNTTVIASTAFVTAAVTVETSRATTAEALLAPLASPTLSGTPLAPTAAPGTNTTQIGSTAFVTAAVLVETNRATTAEALLAPKASPALTGTPTVPTAAAGTNTTQAASTAFAMAIPTPGYLFGLTLSNDGGTPNTVLDIAAGSCADSTNAVKITLGAFTKSTAGSWAAGSGGNGMGAGLTIANSTWYHVFAIINTGAADAYFDTSITAANKPASTTYFRRIGSFKTDSSARIVAFSQNGDRFDLAAPVLEYGATAGVITAITQTLVAVPTGVAVEAILSGDIADATNSNSILYVSSLSQTNLAATVTNQTALLGGAASIYAAASFSDLRIITNASAQIRWRVNSTTASLNLNTNGWIDTRGRFA